MKKIAVIGIGSAGILSLCHFMFYLREYQITSIYDPAMPAVGVGESTNPFFFDSINAGLGIGHYDEFIKNQNIDATIKHSIFYKNWRGEDFHNPLFGNGNHSAIHFNAHKFQNFALNRLRSIWGDRFKEIKGSVESVENIPYGCLVNVDSIDYDFDYVIDCRGFPKDYTNYTIVDLPINHCLVHNTPEINDWGYTLHQATPDGWMFGIPLSTRTSYGYLFNDKITSIDLARKNFASTINIPIEKLDNTEYQFTAYYANTILDGRIIKNGNQAVFFEPMFANSLWLYSFISRLAVDHIEHGYDQSNMNYYFYKKVLEIHDLICYYYQGGSNYDTDFWKYAMNYSKNTLKNSLFFKELDHKFSFMNKTDCYVDIKSFYSTESMLTIDQYLNYNSWPVRRDSNPRPTA